MVSTGSEMRNNSKTYDWSYVLGQIAAGNDLTEQESKDVLTQVLNGQAQDAQLGALLLALKTKGESPLELLGFSDAMVEASNQIKLADNVIDVVGTGGSKQGRGSALNTSTMASFVVAAAGAKVCKHGNRKATSTSGSFDFLERLGVNLNQNSEDIEQSVEQLNLGFVYAKSFHPAMRFAGPVRSQLGVPTVFNLLGPLSHPGRVKKLLLGAANLATAELLAEVLMAKGVTGWVVNGSDGLDELTLNGATNIFEVSEGEVKQSQIHSEQFGLSSRSEPVLGGDSSANLAIFESILKGDSSPQRDLVVYNSAAGLVVAGVCNDLADAIALAEECIDSGKVNELKNRYIKICGNK